MVREIKDAREACTCVLRLVPSTVFTLGPQQICYAASNGIAARVSCREQSHNGPCRLRWSARPNPFGRGLVVRHAALAPPAIGILVHAQPFGSLLNAGLVVIDSDGLEASQHQHGAIDVVDTPASKPRSVGFLLPFQEFDCALYPRIVL